MEIEKETGRKEKILKGNRILKVRETGNEMELRNDVNKKKARKEIKEWGNEKNKIKSKDVDEEDRKGKRKKT